MAAVSCGVFADAPVLDLDYDEDRQAEADANFVVTGAGDIVEIQATAEKIPFSEDQFQALLALARKGIEKLVGLQKLGGGVSRRLTGPVVIATHNPGELRPEMRELLAPYGIAAQSAGELGLGEPEETGKTFAANARIKVMAAARRDRQDSLCQRFRPSGRSARGEPGIHSARWAGPDKDFRCAMNKIQTLLIERGAKAPEQRRAHSSPRCVWRGPTAIRKNSKAASTASRCGRHAARKALVMTRCSNRTDSGAPSAR